MARTGTQSAADAGDTRQRILAIASELFAEKGYAGTSIADISGRLGTTKAALYYHFSSKGDMLTALLGEFLALSADLVEEAIATPLAPEQILGRLIDLTVDSRGLMATVGRDPSVRSAMRAEARRNGSGKQVDVIVSVLVGADQSRAALIRAHSALAITKESTLALIEDNQGALTEEDRAEILAAALRALSAPAAAMSA